MGAQEPRGLLPASAIGRLPHPPLAFSPAATAWPAPCPGSLALLVLYWLASVLAPAPGLCAPQVLPRSVLLVLPLEEEAVQYHSCGG